MVGPYVGRYCSFAPNLTENQIGEHLDYVPADWQQFHALSIDLLKGYAELVEQEIDVLLDSSGGSVYLPSLMR